jgi:septin 7
VFWLHWQVLNEIAQHKIKIYEFPDVDDEEQRKEQRGLRDRVPFAVVGSNTVIEVDGRKVRGRRYPWGVVEGACGRTFPDHFV